VALFPGNFINSDGFDVIEIHEGSSPFDRELHRSENGRPAGIEGVGNLGPAQFLRPPRQKPHIGRRNLVLAIGPRYQFDHDPAVGAVHSAHSVQKEHRNSPEWNKFKASYR
jgi:hypothetical protein